MWTSAALACGGGEPDTGDEVVILDSVQPLPAESLSMPDYPDMERGKLNAVSAGFFDISASLPAQAAACDDPPILMVQAVRPGDPSLGVLVLLQLPEQGDRLTVYPIVTVDSGAPVPPASQIGVQDNRQRVGHAYQGYAGSVELFAFANLVSGRFAVTMRDFQSDVQVKYAGVFHGIPVEQFSEDYCRRYEEGLAMADSGSAAPSR